jgi:hypothetical protein
MKRPPLYIVPFVVMFIIVVAVQLGAPPAINWDPSFTRSDKVPYGAYILYDLLPQIFPNGAVATISEPAYNALSYRGTTGEVYLAVNDRFDVDELDTRALLEYADSGNTLFIAAEDFGGPLVDSLGFQTTMSANPFGDSTSLNFVNPALKARANYRYKRMTVDGYFSQFDTARSVVLGENNDRAANFIMMERGKGRIFLSSVPYAFTNYNLVDSANAGYAFAALSYVDGETILWDEHYKAGRGAAGSPLGYVLGLPSLRWAFFTLLVGVILFMIFMGRRQQRIIPVIKPLPNTTLDFTRTVAQLYLHHRDNKNIAEKKITYFLEHLHSTFGVNTSERSEELYRTIGARSGVDVDHVKSIFGMIDSVRSATVVDSTRLIAINKAIERFYRESTRQGAPGTA